MSRDAKFEVISQKGVNVPGWSCSSALLRMSQFCFSHGELALSSVWGGTRERHVLGQHRKLCCSCSSRFADRRTALQEINLLRPPCRNYRRLQKSTVARASSKLTCTFDSGVVIFYNRTLAAGNATAEICSFCSALNGTDKVRMAAQANSAVEESIDDVLTWKASLPAGWCRSSKLLRLKKAVTSLGPLSTRPPLLMIPTR